jgi:hypothetical protein
MAGMHGRIIDLPCYHFEHGLFQKDVKAADRHIHRSMTTAMLLFMEKRLFIGYESVLHDAQHKKHILIQKYW